MQMIETTDLNVTLAPTPIEPSWIIEGNPVAQGSVLSTSSDGLSCTMVWECTEGKFNWYYDFDETIMILEGSIVLESKTMRSTRYGPGDVIFFRKGAQRAMAGRGPRSQTRLLPDGAALSVGLRAAGVQQDQADSVAVGQDAIRKPGRLGLKSRDRPILSCNCRDIEGGQPVCFGFGESFVEQRP